LAEEMMDIPLVPAETRLEENGAGQAFDISSSVTRTFLCTLAIVEQIEQESLDVSIWGSADGENWGTKPLLKLPQGFYPGETKLVLDISLKPEVKFVRAKWELNRWGRVSPAPMFVAGCKLREIPPMSRETPTKRALVSS
jgi:hypothetical protein